MLWGLLAQILVRIQKERRTLSWQLPLIWNLLKNNNKIRFLVGSYLLYRVSSSSLLPFLKHLIQLRESRRLAAIARDRTARQMAINYDFDPKIVEMIEREGMTAGKLLPKLKSGELTCEEVVRAYIQIAKKTNERINFIVDCLFEEAIERAKFLDNFHQKNGKPYGLLHGLPVSFKETFLMKNRVTFLGSQKLANSRGNEDAALVQRVYAEGGIIIFRTNVPQSLLVPETSNAVFGVTCNPHNLKRAAGGSSGGESAAVGCGASLGGFGTDIGGSCRIPAAWAGCVGFKPTYARLSKKGGKSLNPQFTILSCAGTLSPDVESTIILLEGVTAEEKEGANPPFCSTLDPVLPLPRSWRLNSQPNKTIGVCLFDNFSLPSLSCTRAVKKAANALKKEGWKVIDLSPSSPFVSLLSRCCFLFLALVGWDGGKGTLSKVFGEDIEDFLKPAQKSSGMPLWLRGLLIHFMKFSGEKTCVEVLKAGYPCSAVEVRDLMAERDELKSQLLREWEKLQIGCLLYPAVPTPAVRHGDSGTLLPALSYTYVWNALDFPAGVVPVGKVTKEDVENRVIRKGISPMDKTGNRTDIGSEGLPIAVQVVGKPYRDEECLFVMKEIENALEK